MSLLYINENGAVIGIEENRFVVKYKDGMKRIIPAETLEGITIMGHSQMTTQCTEECLKRGIPVLYLSKGGNYYGRLESVNHVKAERQRKQCALYDTQFALILAKRIISAKLKNQSVVLKRYEKSRGIELNECQKMLKICRDKTESCNSVNEIMGYEGQGAKYYFEGLSACVESDFKFNGRSKRPPLNPFNTMISFGYSILMNELHSKIELKGLNPYFGFIHRDAEKHATLASDMMEEWRAVIVDAVAMSLINGHEICKDDFSYGLDEPGCYFTKNGMKIFINKLEKKLQTEVRYLEYVDYAVSFRQAIALQLNQLVKAVENEDASIYTPIQIR